MVKVKKSFIQRNKKVLVIIALVLFAGLTLIVLEKTNVINLYSSNVEQPSADDTAETTSTTESAQSDFNDGEFREPGNSLIDGEGSASITDNNGSIGSEVDTSNPTVSNTGEITVYSPAKNSTIKSGQTIAGKSTLNKVSYRLIDSVTGMIATGELSVVNGNFSGNITFSTGASQGRLDIFGTKEDLTEFSNVEIPIRF